MKSFKAASAHASAPSFPDSSRQNKLQLYGLYKQATKGSVTGARPGVFDAINRAKYDAWAACESFSQDEARTEYVALVKIIDPGFTPPSQPPAFDAPHSVTAAPLAAETLAAASGDGSAKTTSSVGTCEETKNGGGSGGGLTAKGDGTSGVASGKAKNLSNVWITDIEVPKYTDLEDEQGFRYTVYSVRVTQSDGKVWTVGRRYNEIADLHAGLLGTNSRPATAGLENNKNSNKNGSGGSGCEGAASPVEGGGRGAAGHSSVVSAVACKHPILLAFKFPNKSLFNTFSDHTLERRRVGFNELFKVLLQVIRTGDPSPVVGLAALLSVPASNLALLLPDANPPSYVKTPLQPPPGAGGEREARAPAAAAAAADTTSPRPGTFTPADPPPDAAPLETPSSPLSSSSPSSPSPPSSPSSPTSTAPRSSQTARPQQPSTTSSSGTSTTNTSGVASGGVASGSASGGGDGVGLTSETVAALQARSQRRALAKQNAKGFSVRRVGMALAAIAAGFGWSAFWGLIDVSKVDWMRTGVSTVMLAITTIVLVDFLFMHMKMG